MRMLGDAQGDPVKVIVEKVKVSEISGGNSCGSVRHQIPQCGVAGNND